MVPEPSKQTENHGLTHIKTEKNSSKYTGTDEVLTDTREFFSKIFSKRVRPPGVSIERFLGNIKDKPQVLMKKLTDLEKEEADKKIEEK